MKCRAVFDSWYSAPASKNALESPSNSDTCVCIPEPGVGGERLGHEAGPDALAQRHLTDHGAEGHDVVGGGQRVGVAQVDLLLAGTALVVAELHGDAHRLEHVDRLAAEVRATRLGGVVEVAAAVHGDRVLAGAGPALEEVELDLGVGVEGEALLGSRLQGALEHVARVGVRRGAVGHHDVAEHPGGGRALTAPRQELERRRVGVGQHVRLGDPGEALDRGAVEADALGEGALELGRRDRDRLEVAEHVGEPQPHEPDVALFECAENEVFLLAHGVSLGQAARACASGRQPVASSSRASAIWARTSSSTPSA